MTTHQIHDPDGGIGFDMRNAHLEPYSDSENDEESVDPIHRPRQYKSKQDTLEFNWCYCILIVIIVVGGSGLGFFLGDIFEMHDTQYHPKLNPPKPTQSPYLVSRTPEPTRADPFRNGGINGIFKGDTDLPTPAPKTPAPQSESNPVTDPSTASEPVTEPSAQKEEEGVTEPSAASDGGGNEATEPSAATEPSVASDATEPSAASEPGFATEPSVASDATEPSAATEPSVASDATEPSPAVTTKPVDDEQSSESISIPSESEHSKESKQSEEETHPALDPQIDLNEILDELHNTDSHDVDFDARPLRIDPHNSDGDLDESPLLTKVVFNEYEVPHIFEHAHKFNVKYPFESSHYQSNQWRHWCFHFYLHQYPAAQIDIIFNSFQVERGFDRILIRHFNQSFVDPPLVIAGRGQFDEQKYQWILPETLTYHLRRNEFKSICIEMETDDSIEMEGVDFDVMVRYDDCLWTEYTDCLIPDESKVHWDRGPWYDGVCGIGVQQRKRMSAGTKEAEGFVRCENADLTDVEGPDYCLKAPCERVDNFHNPHGLPNDIRYGWANYTTFFNGIGTLTPDHPDLLRIYTAHPSTPTTFANVDEIKKYMTSPSFLSLYQSYPIYHVHPDQHIFDLQSIIESLKHKRDEIIGEHVDERVLTKPVLDIPPKDQTMKWLGARLTHSLLIGRPFTMIFTGSSNTAGHDNQFESTFSMQLQSRLRSLWSNIGVDGAALNVRNVAVGGNPKTETMAYHIHARSSEKVSYPFNTPPSETLYESTRRRREDVIFWESFMNDGGRPPEIGTEQQVRLTALLNAIFGGMDSIGNIAPKDCHADKKTFDDVNSKKHLGRDHLFQELSDIYGAKMGFIEMNFNNFLDAVCNDKRYQTLKINWHPNARGHRCEADIYAHMLVSAAIQFMADNEAVIKQKMADDGGTQVLDDWLVEQSGEWSANYMRSVINQDFDQFPAPKFCHPFCDETVAPFSLKTSEPNEWDVGFRLSDYVHWDYNSMNDETTKMDEIGGVVEERVPDLKSRFCVEKLARTIGWDYIDNEKGPTHFPQDRTGKIGSMDRKPSFYPNKDIWNQRYQDFLKEKGYDEDLAVVEDGVNRKNGEKLEAARRVMGKRPEEFGDWVLEHDLDIKVAFMVPKIGHHAILAFTGEGGRDFYGFGGAEHQVIGVHLQSMDGSKEMDTSVVSEAFDFGKRITEQRDCNTKQKGCIFSDIAPGKYIMRYYPMNMTDAAVPGLVHIIGF